MPKEIPYLVNKLSMFEKIHQLAKDKIIDGISELKDLSNDRNGIRIEIELKKIGLALINSSEFAALFAEKQTTLPFTAPDAKVLVVDDNEVNLQVADGLLKKFDINCTKAMSGYEALDLLKKQKFDIVFMDHQMPDMDGIETLEKIRKTEEGLDDSEKNIVIALSANAVNGAREMFLSKGFDDFLAKPVQGKDFGACLSKWLDKSLIKLISEPSKTGEADEKTIPADFPTLPEEDINIKKAVSMTDSFETWLSVTKLFISLIGENADLIQKYFADCNYKEYTIKVHALKSAARIVGAENLSSMAENLEKEGNELQAMSDIPQEYLNELKTKTDDMLNYYRSYIDLLEPVKNYGEADDAEKQEASEEKVTAIKNAILNACDNFDLVTVEEEFAQLKKIKLPPELSSKMQELSKAIENIEFDEIAYIFSR